MPRKHQTGSERGRAHHGNDAHGSTGHGKSKQDNEFESLLADLASATQKLAAGSGKKMSPQGRPAAEANGGKKKLPVAVGQRNRSDQAYLEAKMKEQLERKLIIDRILQSFKNAPRTFLDSPETGFHYSEVRDNPRFHVTVGEMQGWRAAMEDEHTIDVAFANGGSPATSSEGLFGVFDGHTGKSCATLCSKIFSAGLHQYARVVPVPQAHAADAAANGGAVISDADGHYRDEGDDDVAQANGNASCHHQVIDFESAFMDLDARIERVLKDQSGCTAVVVHVTPQTVTCASVGDSRAVLCRGGAAVCLSMDHKPEQPEEAERIVAGGGFVRDNRVNGELAMSRSMGDFGYKAQKSLPANAQLVIATPRVIAVERAAEDRFVVLACDGIFDVMSNEELVAFIDERKQGGQENASICEAVCRYCLAPINPITHQPMRAEGTDNMTIMIVDLL